MYRELVKAHLMICISFNFQITNIKNTDLNELILFTS